MVQSRRKSAFQSRSLSKIPCETKAQKLWVVTSTPGTFTLLASYYIFQWLVREFSQPSPQDGCMSCHTALSNTEHSIWIGRDTSWATRWMNQWLFIFHLCLSAEIKWCVFKSIVPLTLGSWVTKHFAWADTYLIIRTKSCHTAVKKQITRDQHNRASAGILMHVITCNTYCSLLHINLGCFFFK